MDLLLPNPTTRDIVVIDDAKDALIICLSVVGDSLVGITLNNGDIWLVDTIDHSKHILRGHKGAVWSMASLGNNLFSGSNDGQILMWSTREGHQIREFIGHTSTVRGLEILSNNKFLSSSRDTDLRIWDITTGSCEHILQGHTDSVRILKTHGFLAVSGSSDNTARIWDTSTGTLKHTLTGHNQSISSVAISNDKILTASFDGVARIWGHDGDCQAILQTAAPITHAYFVLDVPCYLTDHPGDIPAMSKLVTADTTGNIRMWSSSTVESLLQIPAHSNAVLSLDFSGPQMVSAGADGKVKLWDSKTGHLVCELRKQKEPRHVWKAGFCGEQMVIAAMHDSSPSLEIWHVPA